MTNDIKISRELAEGIANYMEGSASGMVQFWHDQLRALLAAPICEKCRGAGKVLISTVCGSVHKTCDKCKIASPAVERQVEIAGYATSSSRGYGSWLFSTEQSAKSHLKTALGGRPMAADVVPLYTSPPAPVAVTPEQLIAAIEKEQARCSAEDYLMDSDDCIAVIREIACLDKAKELIQ